MARKRKEVVLIDRRSFERGGLKVFIRQRRSAVPKSAILASEFKSFKVYHYGAHTYLMPKAGKTLRFD